MLEQFLSTAENEEIQNFLRSIDIDDLVKAFTFLDEACRTRIMKNLSTRTQKSLLEDVEYAFPRVTLDELKKSLCWLRHHAKKIMNENPFVQRPALGEKPFGLLPNVLTAYEVEALLETDEIFSAERIVTAITFAAKAHGARGCRSNRATSSNAIESS
ncbi:MAG: FliG C-terminal domain-containing protein [Sulfuricurvum sp.]|nr:FliG C-terminal domain-containing protein [Sulfuricurvum sp.]